MQVQPPQTSCFSSVVRPLNVQVVTTLEGLSDLRTEWNQLETATGQENPFARWEWIWHWWQVYGRQNSFRHYRLHICVLRDAMASVRAIVPFVLTVWGCFPFTVRALRLFGFRENTIELPTPLISPGWEHAAASALTEALNGQSQRYDQFRFPKSRVFLHSLATDLIAAKRLRICRLHIGEQVVASQIVLTTENSIYLSFSGFDPAWRRYSVMTILAAECIKQAISEERHSVNLSAWSSQNKLRWRPQEVPYRSITVNSLALRSILARRFHRHGIAAARRWLRPWIDNPGDGMREE